MWPPTNEDPETSSDDDTFSSDGSCNSSDRDTACDGEYDYGAEAGDGDIPNDADEDGSRFFGALKYTRKNDIVRAVATYNYRSKRAFKVYESNKRSYTVRYAHEYCEFRVRFAFGSLFKPPTRFHPHTCSILRTNMQSREANRLSHARLVAQDPEVRHLFVLHGRKVIPNMIRKIQEIKGISVSYMNVFNTKKRLITELFGSDEDQYNYLPSYCEMLDSKGHLTALSAPSGGFKSIATLYHECVQTFKNYSSRGPVVDGTFLNDTVGGTLLLACLCNGNNEIQIVLAAVVSAEDKPNWTWFIEFLVSRLDAKPAFIISDRQKGLIGAAKEVCPDIPHMYCFRHVTENFNRKFKSLELKTKAWAMAKSTTAQRFQATAQELIAMKREAHEWLSVIGFEKWSLLHSLVPRFGVLTSNHVESMNAVLKDCRHLPVLNCLLHIEEYVGSAYYKDTQKSASWNQVTHFAEKYIETSVQEHDHGMSMISNSHTTSTVRVDRASTWKRFGASLTPMSCSCGFPRAMLAPCKHVLFAILSTNRNVCIENYFDHTWSTATYREAYPHYAEYEVQPITVKSDLLRSSCKAPAYELYCGRPRHNRRESQKATQALKRAAASKAKKRARESNSQTRIPSIPKMWTMWQCRP